VSETITLRRHQRVPFAPVNSIRKSDSDPAGQFAARHFAVKRAGFILREYARQQEDPRTASVSDEAQPATIESFKESSLEDLASELSFESSTNFTPPSGISQEEVDRRVAEAEQRGREAAQAEWVAALDQAIAALDAAGRAVGDAHRDLERRMVVPLAQASLQIGSELARQALADASGLQRYLESVTTALQPGNSDADPAAVKPVVEVRVNPEDLAVLERASLRPSSITLIADPLVPRSGAIASSENKVVDDRFENRIRFAKEAVLAAAADLLREAPS
jgi:flagellar biosynthesis/type III secretory pathway protein FliH